MNATAIIIFLVIILILLLYYSPVNDNQLRINYKKNLKKSSGSYDYYAKKALNNIKQIKEKQTKDLYYYSLIVDKYKNPNCLYSKKDYRDLVDNYTKLTENINKDINAENTNKNNRLGDRSRENTRLRENTRVHEIDDHNENVYINLVDDFIERTRNEALMRRNLENKRLISVQRLEETVQNNDSKKNTIIDFYKESANDIRNDLQNAHDVSVNKDLKIKYDKIKSPNRDNINNIIRSIDNIQDITPQILSDAKYVAKYIQNNNEYIISVGDNEVNVLENVWARKNYPKNNENHIKEAVVFALASCLDENMLVCCANGRTSRLIGSLDGVDKDPNLPDIMTFELYKQAIMSNSSNILKEMLKKYKASLNQDEINLAKNYDGEDVYVDPNTENNFKNKVLTQINQMIDGYAEHIGEIKLKQLKEECALAINI